MLRETEQGSWIVHQHIGVYDKKAFTCNLFCIHAQVYRWLGEGLLCEFGKGNVVAIR